MKINLLINGNESGYLSGYLNISPLAKYNDTDIQKGNIFNLDEFVEDAEANEIRAINILEYCVGQEVDKTVKNWIRKLSHGGILVLGFTDIYEVTRALQSRTINIHQANDLIYGQQLEEWDFKKCCFHVNHIADYLSMFKLKVITKKIIKYQGLVIGERE